MTPRRSAHHRRGTARPARRVATASVCGAAPVWAVASSRTTARIDRPTTPSQEHLP